MNKESDGSRGCAVLRVFASYCCCPASYTVLSLVDQLNEFLAAGLLVGRGKKVKFRGIFRDKFAEKTADFAGIFEGIFEASFAEK